MSYKCPQGHCQGGGRTCAILEQKQGEIDHPTKAIAAGGDLPSLVAAVKEREQRKADIESEQRSLDELEKMAQVDMGEIEEALWSRAERLAGVAQATERGGTTDTPQAVGWQADL